MDEFVLRQVDRFGDWWQQERGGELPRLLYALVYLQVFTEVAWAVSFFKILYEDPSVVMMILVSVWMIVFSMANILTPSKLRGLAADFDRFDEEGVRKKYQDKALMTRVAHLPSRVFGYVVVPFVMTINVMAMVQEGRLDIVHVAPCAFFVASVLRGLAECIIPRVPRVRREHKLVEAFAGRDA